MTQQRHDIELRGCAPTPLAHYLKALGILRLVAEQADPQAQGWWHNDTFWLRSRLDSDGLATFFLKEYQPTPLVAPWNGGSGFYPKDNQTALRSIVKGDAVQFTSYRETLTACYALLAELKLTEKPKDDEKPKLLQHCRNRLPDAVLPWLDAAYLLTTDGPKYPPLLGTGGNDGRLEFTNNHMQHLLTILPVGQETSPSESHPRIQEALFGEISSARHSGVIGQFDPGNLGGFNNGNGFDGSSTVNAWDYVLMLEGAIAFAAASVKKLESADPGALVYPFCVRPVGVGYESASTADEGLARSEMWLPLWNTPATFMTVSVLLSEGRAETGRRRARNGVDFARAVATLGVDRGIDEFQRYGFHQRNGLAYFAVPLGRFHVRSNADVEQLLAPLDRWLDRFRRAASGKTAPARAGRALRRIETAILKLCQQQTNQKHAGAVQELLIALGEAEAAVAISKKLRKGDKGNGVSPVPLLSPEWVLKANEHSREFRLAAALASVSHEVVGPIRRHCEPIDLEKLPNRKKSKGFAAWADNDDDPAIVWTGGDLIRNLNAVLTRRLIEVMKSGKEPGNTELFAPLDGVCRASLGDITAFIRGDVDNERIQALFKGLMLVNWDRRLWHQIPHEERSQLHGPGQPVPDASYSLLKLCHLPFPVKNQTIKLSPQITHRALAGDGPQATQLATRRLLASGFPPAVDQFACTPDHARRVAAALLFPISPTSAKWLLNTVIRRDPLEEPEDEKTLEPVAIAD